MARPKSTGARRRPLEAEDLFRLKIPTSVSLSPDENLIAYTVERIDSVENTYHSNIHVYDIKSRSERQFTSGKQSDGRPVFSPDGSRMAFVSTRDKKTGVYVMPSDGGAERLVKEFEGGITNLQWTPDGTALVFCLRYADAHFEKDEKKKKEPPVFRHITRFFFRLDGAGFLPQDKWQVYSLTVQDGDLRQITKGKRDNNGVCLSPDGNWIAYVSNRRKDPDIESEQDDLFVAPFAGGRERRIPTPAGPKMAPVFSPDGKTIAYLGHDNPYDAWGVTNFHVWKVGVKGGPQAKDLMPKFDRMAYDQSITDTGERSWSPVLWTRRCQATSVPRFAFWPV